MAAEGSVTLPRPGAPVQPGRAYSPDVDHFPSRLFHGAKSSESSTVGAELAAVASVRGGHRAAAWLTPGGVGEITWGELHHRADRAARALSARVGPGDRVVLVAANSVEWLVAAYACALSGAAFVPVSPRSTAAELGHAIGRSHARAVLLGPGADEDVVERAAVGGDIDAAPSTSIIAALESVGAQISSAPPHPVIDPDAEFLVQLTSGTTGRPKLAVLSHRAALGCARVYVAGVSPEIGDAWFNPLPLHHVGGSVSGALAALVTQGSYTVLDRFDPASALRVLREIAPTVIGMVPTMVIDLLATPTVSRADFVSVRVVVGGASAVDPALIDRTESELGVRFLVGYGQSESPCMAMSSVTDTTEVRIASLGHLLPGRDYAIAAADGLAVAGQVGELCVRGPLMMTGYLDESGAVVAPVDESGWMRTGDLCSLDAHGVLRFHARTREVIIRGGSNIYPAEVEVAVATHPAVDAVAVFGEPDERLGQVVAAAIVLSPGIEGDIGVRDIEEHCREILSSSKVPARWHIVTDMPRTSTGKIRKEQLRDQVSVRPAEGGRGTARTLWP